MWVRDMCVCVSGDGWVEVSCESVLECVRNHVRRFSNTRVMTKVRNEFLKRYTMDQICTLNKVSCFYFRSD